VLGSVFAKVFLEIKEPRVALLSVGTEEGKGNRQVREAHQLFRQSGLNFVGNVEGIDVPLGNVDVVVCDGFVGNILMKFAEGLGMAVVEYVKANLPRGAEQAAGGILGELGNLTNFVEHMGGGPLLGLNGVAIVGHGRSKAPSVTAAINMARTALELGLVEMMRRDLAQVQQRVQSVQER
jgi:glycerol-3-phosphate acyltransferase PlsX